MLKTLKENCLKKKLIKVCLQSLMFYLINLRGTSASLSSVASDSSTKYSGRGFRFGLFSVFSSCWIFADTFPCTGAVGGKEKLTIILTFIYKHFITLFSKSTHLESKHY